MVHLEAADMIFVSPFRNSRRVHYFLKFYVAAAMMLCAILVASCFSPGFHSWNLLYALTTVRIPEHDNILAALTFVTIAAKQQRF